MKSVNCFSIITATAVIALSFLAGTINAAASEDLLLPFNDLLPPLLDTTEIKESTTAKPIITTTPATITTTIKKQQLKELNKDVKVSSIDLKQEQHLHLIPFNDLLPPLVSAETTGTESLLTAKTTPTTIRTTTSRPITAAPTRFTTKTTTTTTKSRLPISETKPTKKSAYKSYTQQGIQQYNAKQQKLKQHVYKQNNVASQPLRQESLQNYLNYFQQTTHRPPKGELPTITPFPRVLKRRQT